MLKLIVSALFLLLSLHSSYAGEPIGQWMPVKKSMLDLVSTGYKVVSFYKEAFKELGSTRTIYLLQKGDSVAQCEEEKHTVGYLHACSILVQPVEK